MDAAAGVVATASHNPASDGGYKVYWKDGCQIRPPVDGAIANVIVDEENLMPWIDYGEQLRRLKAQSNGECYGLSDPVKTKAIEDAYFESIRSSGLITQTNDAATGPTSSAPKIAYTAMHGVGHPYAKRSFETFRLPPFLAVPSQRDPDPTFSTVPFPNPVSRFGLSWMNSFGTSL